MLTLHLIFNVELKLSQPAKLVHIFFLVLIEP